MSIWIRVINRTSLSDVTPEALRAGIVEKLPLLAAKYGEDAAKSVAENVAIRRAKGESGEFDVYELRWMADQPKAVRIERWVDKRAEEELSDLSEWLESYLEEEEDEGAEEIAHALEAAEETVGLELHASHTEGIGWPIAMAAAHYLAEVGDGLIRAEGEGWLAPEEGELRHILEAD